MKNIVVGGFTVFVAVPPKPPKTPCLIPVANILFAFPHLTVGGIRRCEDTTPSRLPPPCGEFVPHKRGFAPLKTEIHEGNRL